MGFLPFHKKNHCEICHQAFDKREQLLKHAKEEHHKPILKCPNCGMQLSSKLDYNDIWSSHTIKFKYLGYLYHNFSVLL